MTPGRQLIQMWIYHMSLSAFRARVFIHRQYSQSHALSSFQLFSLFCFFFLSFVLMNFSFVLKEVSHKNITPICVIYTCMLLKFKALRVKTLGNFNLTFFIIILGKSSYIYPVNYREKGSLILSNYFVFSFWFKKKKKACEVCKWIQIE